MFLTWLLAIEDYISRAKKKRAEVLSQGKKKELVVENELFCMWVLVSGIPKDFKLLCDQCFRT